MIENYVFAAMDFIVSKQDEIYFIEANSSPGVLKRYQKVYNHCKPVEKLCALLNKRYKKLAVITKNNYSCHYKYHVFQKKGFSLCMICLGHFWQSIL